MLSKRGSAGALLAMSLIASLVVAITGGATVSAAANDQPLSGSTSAMWQTNNTVYAVAAGGGRLFAGGVFTRVRPPGAAAGSNETTRNYIAAFSASTGALNTNWNATLNGSVRDMALSPDGSRLYIAGQFTTVNGQARQRVAALNASTGALIGGWQANTNATVTALKVTASRVYLGGDFSTVRGVSKARMAAVDTSTGAVIGGFTANTDGRVNSIATDSANTRVVFGGAFDTVNGTAKHAIASVSPTNGALQPWAADGIIPGPAPCDSTTTGIRIVGTVAYVTAEGLEPGCWEGVYAANISNGSVVWNQHCLGAGQDVEVIGGWVYKASHQHDCGYNDGAKGSGYVGTQNPNDFTWKRLAAHNTVDGGFGHWSPDTNGGTSPGVGPHALATDGTQLLVGGDFTAVNGATQQGLARFQPGNGQAPRTPTTAPSVTATGPGRLTITAGTVEDRDSGTLTYSLYQDGSSTPIQTRTAESWQWSAPTVRFDVTGLPVGSSHTYRVRASDGARQGSLGPASAPVTVIGTTPSSFDSTVLSHGPAAYWRLADAGTTATDASANGRTGTFHGGVTRGQGGALASNAAIALDGSSGYVSSNTPIPASTSFTQSTWVNTTTTRGGTLLAMSDAPSGLGAAADRVVWMDNNGQVVAGIRTATGTRTRVQYVRAPHTINDGQWHHVAATYNGATLSIYVDGALAGTVAQTTRAPLSSQYLRAGYANLLAFDTVFGNNFSSGQTAPRSFFLAGRLDEVAALPSALSAAQVRALWAAGIGNGTTPTPTTTTTSTTTTSTTTSTTTTSTSTTTTTLPGGGTSYPATVAADSPSAYWRLNEPSRVTVADSSGNNVTGTYRSSGLTYGAAGVLTTGPNSAVVSAGSSGVSYTNTIGAGPTTFSLEAWIRTSSTSGGKILGLENVQTGWGASYDRQIYMTNNGRIAYGIVSGGVRQVATSAGSFNNGQWHHVVATQGPAGMVLYVDGAVVASNTTTTPDPANGFWRIGGGNLTGWANAPSSSALSGSYDEVAVYPTALSAARVAAHFQARTA